MATRGKLVYHMKAVHENLKRPKKPKKAPKPHKKHPKKPIAALLTGAILPREVEREIIVGGKTFELSQPELSQEVAALKSDSENEVTAVVQMEGPAVAGTNLDRDAEPELEEPLFDKATGFYQVPVPKMGETADGDGQKKVDPCPPCFLLPARNLKITIL